MTSTTQFTDIVKRIDNIQLSEVFGNNAVNIKSLATSVSKSVLSLSTNGIKISENDKNNIMTFLNNISSSVSTFCDFLDYNNNGKVELIRRNSDGKIGYGADISAVIEDGKDIINPIFKGDKNVPVIIMSTMTNILSLLTNENIINAKNDYNAFKKSCEKTFASFSLIKNVDRAKLFSENADDIIRFIIVLCVVIAPLIELIEQKHKKGESVISAKDISSFVTEYYGSNIDDLLKMIENIVGAFVKIVGASSAGKKISKFFKCLCCMSTSAVEPDA